MVLSVRPVLYQMWGHDQKAVCFSVAVIKCPDQKQRGEERAYTLRSQSIIEGRSQSRESCRTHGEVLPPSSLTGWGLASFLIQPRATCPEMVPPTVGPPVGLCQVKKFVTDMSTVQPGRGHSSDVLLLAHVTLGSVKLTLFALCYEALFRRKLSLKPDMVCAWYIGVPTAF